MSDHPVGLSIRGGVRVYPGTRALRGVDFDVRMGAVSVLVGENGAGKSTLMKIVAGVEPLTEGRIEMDGREVAVRSRDEAEAAGIGAVFQELDLFPDLSVAEKVFIGRKITRAGRIDRAAQRWRTAELMARLEQDIDPDATLGSLRIGEQQIVEIAKALNGDPREHHAVLAAALHPRPDRPRSRGRGEGRSGLRAPPRHQGPEPLVLLLLKARTFIALIVVFVFFAAMAPNFLTTANMLIMDKHLVLNAFLAIGMTFVIFTGGIDLSVGSIVGLCGMVAGYLVLNGIDLGFAWTIQFNTLEISLLTILVGVGIGLVNGILITRLNVAPFIATLGTLYVARGAALLASGGATFPNLSGNPEWGSHTFRLIGAGNVFGIPVSIWLLVAVAAGAAYVARSTPLGRHIYAVGGNERGAALSGVKVRRVKLFVYMFSGFCAALVGLVIASQLQAAHPATGETFELNAIAAAVLGGTSMSGGRGWIGGTIVGAFVIGILSDGLVMMGVSTFWQTVIKGLVIIAAVVVDQAQSRLEARVILRQQAALG